MFCIKVKEKFSSAHYLRNYSGKCEQLHGHNWIVEVEIAGELSENEMVIDFAIVKDKLKSFLNSNLDHRLINEIPYFKEHNPTAENIARFIFNHMKKEFSGLKKVTVWESEAAGVSYEE